MEKNKSRILKEARKKAVKKAHISDRLRDLYDISIDSHMGKIVVRKKIDSDS